MKIKFEAGDIHLIISGRLKGKSIILTEDSGENSISCKGKLWEPGESDLKDIRIKITDIEKKKSGSMPQFKKKYNWSQIPPEVDYVVTNASGEVWGFYYPPQKDLKKEKWINPPGSHLEEPTELTNLTPYDGNWEDSLEQRTA